MIGRPTVDGALEDYLDMKPFHSFPLFHGSHQTKNFRQAAIFKGIIKVTAKDEPIDDALGEIATTAQKLLRVYVLDGINLTPKDRNGKSDPYLKLKIGSHKESTRKRFNKENINPGFYERFRTISHSA